MDRLNFTTKGPEEKILQAITEFLKLRDWFVKRTHGNMYQSGFPDLYCTHKSYGPRWVEVKNPLKYSFTPAQRETFPLLAANGTQIWILTAATEEEYQKLFKRGNWWHFLEIMK